MLRISNSIPKELEPQHATKHSTTSVNFDPDAQFEMLWQRQGEQWLQQLSAAVVANANSSNSTSITSSCYNSSNTGRATAAVKSPTEKTQNVRVMCRFRPPEHGCRELCPFTFSKGATSSNVSSSQLDNTTSTAAKENVVVRPGNHNKHGSNLFRFDKVYKPPPVKLQDNHGNNLYPAQLGRQQEEIFHDIGAPMIADALDG